MVSSQQAKPIRIIALVEYVLFWYKNVIFFCFSVTLGGTKIWISTPCNLKFKPIGCKNVGMAENTIREQIGINEIHSFLWTASQISLFLDSHLLDILGWGTFQTRISLMCCSPKLKRMSQRENIYWSMDFASIFLKEWLWKNVNDRTCKVTNSTPVLWNHTGGANWHCTSIFWLHKCLPLTVWNQHVRTISKFNTSFFTGNAVTLKCVYFQRQWGGCFRTEPRVTFPLIV